MTEPGGRIAYVQAGWHQEITDGCKASFVAEMASRGYDATVIDVVTVPGSLEIPLVAKRLAQSGRYAAICASGLVVDGGIYRHEFVAQAVLSGIVQVSLETGVPVLSAVLTPQQFHEHEAHLRFFEQHMHVKGLELASACATMIATLRSLPGTEG